MKQGFRITRIGVVLLVLLAASIVAVFVGSSGVQTAGFAVATLIIVFLVADQLTTRVGWFGLITMGRADTSPIAKGRDEPEYIERADQPSEEAWEREEASYRAKNSEPADAGGPG